MMFSALSDLKPSKQVEELGVWEKEELLSFQKPVKPEMPGDDPLPLPGKHAERVELSMTEAMVTTEAGSLLSHAPSYRTYAQDLPPGHKGPPDRTLHDYGRHRLHAFLQAVAERPRVLEAEVLKRRGEPLVRWRRHRAV